MYTPSKFNFCVSVINFNMEEAKLYTCFQATNHLGEPVYKIYSAKLSDLQDEKIGSTPEFNLEVVIKGLDSMGCGVFGSKIVLAGGRVSLEEDKIYRRGMITYDTETKLVSHVDIPPMQGLKIRPLVFELYERLYVLNTSTYVHRRSFEIYYPNQKIWQKMQNPYYNESSAFAGNPKISGRNPYSWFVSGNCLCISVPESRPTYLHHARQVCKTFYSDYDEQLPFRGMATTYWHPDFSDVVVIYFSQDCVQGRRVNLCPSYFGEPKFFGEPKKIFNIVSYKPDGERSSYFTDFGQGNFCLAIFDDVSIHVSMFTIHREPDGKNGALNINLTHLVNHKYNFSDFSLGGNEIVSFLGCFALPTDDRKKRVEEANLYRHHFLYLESGEKDDDVPLPKTGKPLFKRIKQQCDDYDSDSDVEMYG